MEEDIERGSKFYSSNIDRKSAEVFFNSDMRTNRDISEIAASVFFERLDETPRIADALAASGIRGFRLAKYGDIWLNDSKPAAVEAIKKGLRTNSIEGKIDDVDANIFLSEHRKFFHYVDIDPFGSFVNFLDSAARACHYDGFAGFTATDNGAVSGSHPSVCRRRYQSEPLKNSFMHEIGLRIYLKEVVGNFCRFDKAFVPKVCWHERHYTRVMGRVIESKSLCNDLADEIGFISYCGECGWRSLDRKSLCDRCSSETDIAGPLWTGSIIDEEFSEEIFERIPDNWEKSKKLVDKLRNEAVINVPYYDIHNICSLHDLDVPRKDKLLDYLRDMDFESSQTHFSGTGIRTRADLDSILEGIKELN